MKKELYLQKVLPMELGEAVSIIEQGRQYLKSQGIDQWQSGYPNEADIQKDLAEGKGFFLTDGVSRMAYMCLDFEGEPAYADIGGKWLTDRNAAYLVIHRLAFDSRFREKGLSKKVFELAERLCCERGVKSIRVDTDADNRIMQSALGSAGFVYCGTIWFAGGSKLAFEKTVER